MTTDAGVRVESLSGAVSSAVMVTIQPVGLVADAVGIAYDFGPAGTLFAAR